jgi:hypothetical protein
MKVKVFWTCFLFVCYDVLMNKTVNINPIGFLSFFSFVGIAVIIFFYKIGSINPLTCATVSILLLALGIVSALAVKNGDKNPALQAAFKLILIIFSSIFALFVVGAIMLGMSG